MSPELIKKFFEKHCTEEEAAQVSDFLKVNPDIAELYLSEHEWKTVDTDRQIPPEYWSSAWRVIEQKKKKSTRILLMKRLAIAACVAVVLAGSGYYFLSVNKNIKGKDEIAAVKPHPKKLTNTTTDIISFVLQDGSIAELSPKSEIIYEEPSQQNKRIVYLTGEARFKVAKDVNRSFAVFSGDIVTIALGTQFKVTAFSGAADIKVKLFEGKVMVESADTINGKLKKDYYLLPGDEFYFDRKTMLAKVLSESRDNLIAKNTRPAGENNTTGKTGTNWYMFNNESLVHVFAQLESIYNIRISYDTKDIKGKNYIGRIEKTDSIESILKDIGILNDLSIVKAGNTYSVRKK